MSKRQSWTLRGGVPSPFRQTRPQDHPAARRALTQVNRHHWSAWKRYVKRLEGESK